MPLVLRVVACASLLLPAAVAQTVWNVAAGADLQTAIDNAIPGDVLVLTNWSTGYDYAPFTLAKGLTIRGNGASVGVSMFGTVYQVTIAVPPGQVAHVERLATGPLTGVAGAASAAVVVQGGTVRFEDCTFSHLDTALVVNAANVTFAGGSAASSGQQLLGPSLQYARGNGIVATQAQLVLRDCTVTGAFAAQQPWGPSLAQAGLQLTASSLHAERASLQGGQNWNPGLVTSGGAGVVATSSTLWISDSTVAGGSSVTGVAGTALVNTNGPTASLASTLLAPGAGGQASVGSIDPNAPLLRLQRTSAWQRGATSTLNLRGRAGAVFGLWLAPDPAPTMLAPVVEPVWVVTGVPILVGLLDAAGAATYPVPVPAIPALEHATVWCQAHGGLQLPLHTTTIAGGVVR